MTKPDTSILEVLPLALFRTDVEGRCTYVNPRYCHMTGLTCENAHAMWWQQGVHCDDQPWVSRKWLQALQADRPFHCEFHLQHPDGHLTWVYAQLDVERDGVGHMSGYWGTLTAIDHPQQQEARCRKAETALQESETKFQRVVESLPGVLYQYVLHLDGSAEFAFISSRAQEIYELDSKAFLQNADLMWSRVHPDDHLYLQTRIGISAQTGQPFYAEHRIVTPRGGLKWLEAIATPEFQDNGDIVWDVLALDISDRKLIEEQLYDSEMRYRLLSAMSPVGIFRFNEAGKCTYVNEKLAQLIGYAPEFCLEDNWLNTIHPDDRQLMIDSWQDFIPLAAIDPTATHQIEIRQIRPDGSMIWVLGQAVAERNAQGTVVGYIGTLTDISDRKRAEIQLQQLNQALEIKVQERTAKLQEREKELIRVTRLKDDFLANMSHELRTPLNAILGMSEGLLEGVLGSVNATQVKAIQTIERSGNHLLALINDILDVAKIESGKFELDYTLTSVAYICQSSLTFVTPQAEKKQIRLTSHFPANLPQFWLDERRFIQALTNLLANAVKFTPEAGQVCLEVTYEAEGLSRESAASGEVYQLRSFASSAELNLASRDAAGWQPALRIAVRDTGIGIAPDDLEKLFHPFVQIENTPNRRHTGTGLGLVLVKRIVELHGGTVEVSSQVGVGSCFAIALPGQTDPQIEH